MDVNYRSSIDFSRSRYIMYNLGILFWIIFLTKFDAMNIYAYLSCSHDKLNNSQISALKKKIQPEKCYLSSLWGEK